LHIDVNFLCRLFLWCVQRQLYQFQAVLAAVISVSSRFNIIP
jgi:hypothetical protein